MRIYEIKMIKPLTPAQARMRSLKVNADRAKNALKAERSRQKIVQGQQELTASRKKNSRF